MFISLLYLNNNDIHSVHVHKISSSHFIQKKSATAKIGEFFKLPSFRRKNKSGKLSSPGNGNSGGGSGGDTTKHSATASVMPDGRCPDSCFDAVSVMSMGM